MPELKVKYFKGWLKTESMDESPESWFDSWYMTIKSNELNNFKTLVFKIPEDKETKLIVEIEKLIQKICQE